MWGAAGPHPPPRPPSRLLEVLCEMANEAKATLRRLLKWFSNTLLQKNIKWIPLHLRSLGVSLNTSKRIFDCKVYCGKMNELINRDLKIDCKKNLTSTLSKLNAYTSHRNKWNKYIHLWNCKVTDITNICDISAIYRNFTKLQHWYWVCSGKFHWTKMNEFDLRWIIKDKSGHKDKTQYTGLGRLPPEPRGTNMNY